jgi:hypothetical protein
MCSGSKPRLYGKRGNRLGDPHSHSQAPSCGTAEATALFHMEAKSKASTDKALGPLVHLRLLQRTSVCATT